MLLSAAIPARTQGSHIFNTEEEKQIVNLEFYSRQKYLPRMKGNQYFGRHAEAKHISSSDKGKIQQVEIQKN